MDLKTQITALERFKKTLGSLSFTASIDKNGNARVKFLKKIVIAECPDRIFAESFAESLNGVVKNNHTRVEEILNHLAVRCEYLSLFARESINAKITGSSGETSGRTLYPNIENPARKELPEGLFECPGPGGIDVQHGAAGVS